ncbi:NERD domain-containing protein [Cellulomonas flavigena DSM 20109]|uniref:NERD domain-containing protein n=1 Tax=Cellulomonas flavigena (strain ATCC 482 / DSM 20109 / BCRC 11376 / JCM 18109 / NBRC 3775 / NCIMB 8073 / NRS 134) TaxID=446466 RepID=D5UCL4_CELFN|nr:hypothetical protein [Cellulomonas flavigena]ADG76249.1 NERD domain-containing protein [Cellulomonas flavigena DSM 20109]
MSTHEHADVRRGRSAARHGLPSWARHTGGTVAVAGLLHGVARDGWTTLDDTRHPGGATGATGHVLVGPGGVVVVDVRPAAGRRHDAAAVAEGEQAAARSAAVVTSLLAPRHRSAVRSVVCLVDGSRPGGDVVRDAVAAGAHPGAGAAGAVVAGQEGLTAWLRALPARLHAQDVAGLAQHLDLALALPPDVLTTHALETDRRVTRRRAVGPLTAAAPPDVARSTALGLALRACVVVSTVWLAWVFTTAPLGLG